MPAMFETRYIGDGVYVVFDGYHYKLMTGSHDNPDNVVYLEPQVLKQFQMYQVYVQERAKQLMELHNVKEAESGPK